MKAIASIIAVFLLLFSFTSAQDKNYFEKGKKFILKEKLKVTPLELLKNIEKLQKKNKSNVSKSSDDNKKLTLQSYDYSVSSTKYSESEIHAVINPIDSNNIIVSPIELTNDFMLEIDCPIYYTTDFGKSWNNSNFSIIPNESNVFTAGGGDPLLTFDKNGNAYMSWILLYYTVDDTFNIDSLFNIMGCAISTDKGINWEPLGDGIVAKVGIDLKNNQQLEDFYDKQWMAADLSNGQYSNNVYLSLTHINTNEYIIELYTKLSGKSQFEKLPTKVNYFNHSMVQFSNMVVDSDGKIHIIFWGTEDGTKNSLFHTVSQDGGKTFSKEIKITDFKLLGASMLPYDGVEEYAGLNSDRLYPCPQLAVDKSGGINDGNLYLTWTANGIDTNEYKSLNVYFTKSTDGGETWSKPIIIHNDNTQTAKFYPSISVNPNGVVVVTWYDRRNDKNNDMTDYYMTFSFDGGNTFIKDFPVTSKPTRFSSVGYLNQDFGIGEYNALVTTKGYAIPFWSDGRNNDGNLNVYCAFIPISENTSSVESINSINNQIIISSISPNPAINKINVNYSVSKGYEDDLKMSIFSLDSKFIREINLSNHINSIEIDISDLSNGEYLLFLKSKGIYSVKKFVVMR